MGSYLRILIPVVFVILTPLAAAADYACSMSCYLDHERFAAMCSTASESDMRQCREHYQYCMSTCPLGPIGGCGHSCRRDLSTCQDIANDAYLRCIKLITNDTKACLRDCGWIVVE